MKKIILAGVVLLAAAGCGGGSSPPAAKASPTASPTPLTQEIDVSLSLFDNTGSDLGLLGHAFTSTTGGCSGTPNGGFDDITPGTGVELLGPDGTVLSSTSLELGTVAPAAAGDPASCVFSIVFPDVPTVPVAKVSVANRGALAFQWEDLAVGAYESLNAPPPK